MPKMKSNRAAGKRFRVTGTGKIKHKKAYARHILSTKSRARKRDFRRLWIARINAAARIHGTSYSRLICGLRRAGIEVNRKTLADLAGRDDRAFEALVKRARSDS